MSPPDSDMILYCRKGPEQYTKNRATGFRLQHLAKDLFNLANLATQQRPQTCKLPSNQDANTDSTPSISSGQVQVTQHHLTEIPFNAATPNSTDHNKIQG